MMRIELLMPSRGRPEEAAEAVFEAVSLADEPDRVGAVVRVDDDDPRLEDYLDVHPDDWRVVAGPPMKFLSAYWTELAIEHSAAPVMQLAADDMRHRTRGWDTVVREAFDAAPDRLVLAYGLDPIHGHGLATHPFFHRRWVEALGHVTWPRFGRDWADVWMHRVAGANHRLRPLPIEVDHLHWLRFADRLDDTYERRLGMTGEAREEWDRLQLRLGADASKLARAILEDRQR